MAKKHAIENDVTELWKDYRHAQQQRRADRLPERVREIVALRDEGYTVQALTEYQFRINGMLDVYPVHRRFHDLVRQKRGTYENVLDLVFRRLRKADQ